MIKGIKGVVGIVILMCISWHLNAKHIIGGVMTYECLEEGTYRIMVKIYRDCSDPTGAFFDNPMSISIFRGEDETLIDLLDIDLLSISEVDPPDDPCLIVPPGVCVEEGIYEFEYTFEDWPIAEDYTLSYQRCCRNNTITNMILPNENGATFSTRITAASQQVCNSSPVFDSFPPTVLCVGEELNFIHTATDPDGDQLVYEFCSPIKGGGPIGSAGNPGDSNSWGGVIPIPTSPPSEWEDIGFLPPFSALNPMGGDPQITIDATTGLISGGIMFAGQFVVGVCVYEYRDGELLSTTLRDFQFNVTPCEELVGINLPEAEIVLDTLIFIYCNDENLVSIENESFQEEFIVGHEWEIVVSEEDTLFLNGKDIELTFENSGTYTGTYYLYGQGGCNDTSNLVFHLYPPLYSNFEFDYDTCVAGPIFFESTGFSEGGPIVSYDWNFGMEAIDSIANPYHEYIEPGLFPVLHTITDTNNCEADTIIEVLYQPVPNLIIISPSSELTCPPETITFENLSTPVDSTYTFLWDFGDGGLDTVISPAHIYDSVGVYDVSLLITSPIGCITDTIFPSLIDVRPPPIAGFVYEAKHFSNFSTDIEIEDLSQFGLFYEWYDNDSLFSKKSGIIDHVFADTGWHEIKQIVYSEQLCVDTITSLVDVIPEIRYYLPNAFSPNFDTHNDEMAGAGYLRAIKDYDMKIWNRYGEIVFESNTHKKTWDGSKHNNGNLLPSGIYICEVNIVGPRGKDFNYQTWVRLLY